MRAGGAALALLAIAGCGSAPVPPPADLTQPGWTVWSGQALWQRPGRPPLAGELTVARHDGGDVVVTFAKPPVPIFTARTLGRRWRLDLVDRERAHRGRGRPPRRFVWFRLPEVLAGGAPPVHWRLSRPAPLELLLEHERSGESVRLVLDG